LLRDEEIDEIRRAGRAVRAALDAAASACRPGVSTAALDAAAAEALGNLGARAIFLGQPAEAGSPDVTVYPATTCISINEEVVHGIPGERTISEGDLVSIDCGAAVDGPFGTLCADAAVTVAVGPVDLRAARLLRVTEAMLDEAIGLIRPGLLWSSIARRLQAMADEAGLSIISEYVGHGIGRSLHEPPEVPSFWQDDAQHGSCTSVQDFTLRVGMALAIEPLLALGSPRTLRQSNGWTVSTLDGSSSAHAEHTIVVTPLGAEVVTGPSPKSAGDARLASICPNLN